MTAAFALLGRLAAPALGLLLARRARQGKEDPARLGERRGRSALARPAGRLLWIHGASVGEARSVLPLLAMILDAYPGASALVTTGTLASARLLDTALPPRARHQFAPLDVPAWVARFLDHWRPDAALWVESELWPNMLSALAARGVPAALVNARLSAGSFARWRRLGRALRPPLGSFARVLAQSEADAARFAALGARGVAMPGNLKFDAAILPADAAALEGLRAALGARPRWLAASTHEGEEEIAAAAHEALAPALPGLLTILVPRHAARGEEIARLLAARGLAVARRGRGELPGAATDVYLADTMGELGLFYRLAPVAFVGRSLARGGGQNPLEAAALGAAVLAGPLTGNFGDIYAGLAQAGGARIVRDGAALTDALAALLADPAACAALAARAGAAIASGRGATARTLAELGPLLEALDGADGHARA
jgi:3-deoxy-D-manno-octulosonic-acid transferase